MNDRRIRIAFASASIMLCLAMITGCGNSQADVAGVYELDKEAIRAAAKKEMEAQANAENGDGMAALGSTMALGLIESMTMTLTLSEDGAATMVTNAMGQTDNAAGTWTLDDDTITFSIKSEGESPKSATGTVAGDTITMHPEEGEDAPFDMVFKKKQK